MENQELSIANSGRVFMKTAIKTYVIDFPKVKTLEDVVNIINEINIQFHGYGDYFHENIKRLLDKGLIVEEAKTP